MASTTIVGVCPSCNTWDFWIAKEFAHALLALALGLELAARAFRPVPQPWLWARVVIAASVALAAALLWSVPAGPVSMRVLPWLLAALAWLYTGLGLVALYFGMPIEPLHRALLWGLSDLMIYAATLGQTSDDVTLPNLFNPLMFTAALAALTWTAWRPDTTPPDAHPDTVRWLWSWRKTP